MKSLKKIKNSKRNKLHSKKTKKVKKVKNTKGCMKGGMPSSSGSRRKAQQALADVVPNSWIKNRF